MQAEHEHLEKLSQLSTGHLACPTNADHQSTKKGRPSAFADKNKDEVLNETGLQDFASKLQQACGELTAPPFCDPLCEQKQFQNACVQKGEVLPP